MTQRHIDHLVYATRDLEHTIGALKEQLGVRAALGGSHPGRGTRNALIALGSSSYLEIIGPDAEQAAPTGKRWLGVDDVNSPTLVTWAAKSNDLNKVAERARLAGIPIGPIRAGRRTRTDGVELSWQLTDAQQLIADGVVPFFIDWGNSPHPAETAPGGLSLCDLRAEHPEADSVRAMCQTLGVEISITQGRAPALIATLESPKGMVVLR